MKFIKEPPDGKTRNHIERTMGKIGEAAYPIDQREPDGHQGKRKTIDNTVDEDIHLSKIRNSNIEIPAFAEAATRRQAKQIQITEIRI